jgi:hyperosmotically inducible protein
MKYIPVVILSLCLSGCAVFQGKSSPDQYTSDAAATTQIKSKLIGSDIVSAPNIHVETQNGVVQLSGFVSNYAQVREAEQLARSVNGVKRVINNLVVAPPPKSRYKKE